MEKVVGSSPIIRLRKPLETGVFCCLEVEQHDRKWLGSALCLNEHLGQGVGLSARAAAITSSRLQERMRT